VRQLAERELSTEEFNAYVNAPMSDEERQEILDSVAWFTRRYPTAAERFAATRRAYRQWTWRDRLQEPKDGQDPGTDSD
jgi:hypothetical protein